MSISITRTNSDHQDFVQLVHSLENHLNATDEQAHSLCKQYNELETINHVILVYVNGEAAGCGAIRAFNENAVEIKRMFVEEKFRKMGVGTKILLELEKWAKELNYNECILETGYSLPEAVCLYERNNYIRIPNYGQYITMEKSICFSKFLNLK